MDDFNTALLREKIVFVDEESGKEAGADGHSVVRSNRIYLKLEKDGKSEKVVVRAQNMHTTLRVAGKIMQEFYRKGLLTPHAGSIVWEDMWYELQSNYEREYNPYNWGAIYINGQSVFRTKDSSFVDIIEKCALLTTDNYDATVAVTEGALKQIGKPMRVTQSTTVAAVFTDTGENLRCGIIHRAGGKDTAFNFTVSGGERNHRVVQTLGIAAAFLEAVNLRHIIDSLEAKVRAGQRETAEMGQLRAATARLTAIDRGIKSFEEVYDVRYRPEKPVFFPVEA